MGGEEVFWKKEDDNSYPMGFLTGLFIKITI
jgi:hypothetical protein